MIIVNVSCKTLNDKDSPFAAYKSDFYSIPEVGNGTYFCVYCFSITFKRD